MNNYLIKRIIKWIRNAIILIISIFFLYFSLAVILTIIPVNSDYHPPDNGIEIFLISNNIHIDFVLPVKNAQKNWEEDFPLKTFKLVDSSFNFISFGWGDRNFYLNTPTWADLKWDIALKALFLPTNTLMHITYLRSKPAVSNLTKKIVISIEQYKKLIHYLDSSFRKDSKNKNILIRISYNSFFENYYEANGSYNLINTCNHWTNQGLKYSGVKTATWAPFDKCVLYHN